MSNREIEFIAVAKLFKSSLNARKTDSKTACEELKASILSHGLMQNLTVIAGKKGKYEVIAGGRRLAALKSLIADGKLPEDHAVPCQVASEERAYEMSLAENTVRLAMHPADEHAAYAVLANSGESPEAIAQRFGKTEKHVLQRLKLGRAAPELIQAYRDGEIKLETLEAFTITDDKKRQLSVYKSLQGWQQGNARHVRACLTEQMTGADDKLAKFVGIEAYQTAGGKVKTDLFGEDVYLEDTALLQRLAAEKLEAEAESLRQDGWGWVEADFEVGCATISKFGRIKPIPLDAPAELMTELAEAEAEQTRIAELIDTAYESDDENEELIEGLESQATAIEKKIEGIEAKLESFIDFDPEQKKVAGCFVSVGYSGNIAIERGLVKREDAKKVAASASHDSHDEDADEKPKGMSESLKRDLEAYRLAAAQAEIAKHPAIAFDLLVFKAAKSVCSIGHPYDGLQVSFNQQSGGTASADAREFISSRMDAIEKTLPIDWLEIDNEFDQFFAFQRLTAEQKHAILAYCVARTLQPRLAPNSEKVADGAVTAYDIALSQTGASVADYWRPTKDNYLSRVNSSQLLETYDVIFGAEFTKHRRNYKKAQLVDELDKAFADPENQICTDKLKSWLPEGMAFPAIEPPAETKPAKAKKGKKEA